MPFIAIIFLVFALFLAARVSRGSQAVWLVLALATFGCCILGLVGLITRFGNYRLAGLVIIPLDRPAWVGDLLAHLSLSWFTRFRLWSLIGFVASVLGFSLSYTTDSRTRAAYLAAAGFALPAAILCWYYDPSHLFTVYREGAALVGDAAARNRPGSATSGSSTAWPWSLSWRRCSLPTAACSSSGSAPPSRRRRPRRSASGSATDCSRPSSPSSSASAPPAS